MITWAAPKFRSQASQFVPVPHKIPHPNFRLGHAVFSMKTVPRWLDETQRHDGPRGVYITDSVYRLSRCSVPTGAYGAFDLSTFLKTVYCNFDQSYAIDNTRRPLHYVISVVLGTICKSKSGSIEKEFLVNISRMV